MLGVVSAAVVWNSMARAGLYVCARCFLVAYGFQACLYTFAEAVYGRKPAAAKAEDRQEMLVEFAFVLLLCGFC